MLKHKVSSVQIKTGICSSINLLIGWSLGSIDVVNKFDEKQTSIGIFNYLTFSN